jgi:peptidoglycan/LPS O-acetylase OafA/YrhL
LKNRRIGTLSIDRSALSREAVEGESGKILRPSGPATTAASLIADSGDARLRYVDAVRVWAVALVFVVHVAEVFNPWDEWHITNGQRSRAAGEVALFAAPWVMPIIMLLAGVSAWYSLQRRGNGEYVRERVVRVLFPLIIGTLTLVPPQVYLERRLRGQFQGSFIEFYPHFFQGIYPNGNLSWHHLWFLAHLFLYSLIALPLFRGWLRRGGGRTMRWAARVSGAPGGILWLAIPLILERNLLWGLFPERHMLASDWSNHALLFVAYVYGFVLAGTPWLGRAIDAQWPRALATALIGTVGLSIGAWVGIVPTRIPPPYSLEYLAFWTLYALGAWAWMVAILGMARRWLDGDSAVVRYGRRTGYTVYIVHQPIIVAVAYLVVQTSASVAWKFATIFVISGVATFLSAELLTRLLIPALSGSRRQPA